MNFARYCGYVFAGADREDFYHVEINGDKKKYKLLHVLEFNSKRKRMSVILKDEETGKVLILCKGADSIIDKRLAKSERAESDKAFASLESFGKEGLRTLMLAMREIPGAEYEKWKANYTAASTAMSNREQLMEDEQDKIEVELLIVGCTAIEDKLQDEVPETIEMLLKANIKLWVLTGDKGSQDLTKSKLL